MSVKAQITHVIFDLDGLLLDTESIYTACSQEILDTYGLKFEWSLKSKMMGRPGLEAARILVEELKLPMTPEQFFTELYSRVNKKFPDARFLPGAVALIKHLQAIGIPTAIATGSGKSAYQLKISKHKELFDIMSHAVCSDDTDVVNGKPSPDIYQIAAARFKIPPSSPTNVLVFEDAPNGVEAGKAAGMNVVMVPDKRTDLEKCVKADVILKTLEDLDLTEWGLKSI